MKYIKKLLSFTGAWVLFYLGHWTSFIMNFPLFYWLFNFYSWCMVNSLKIQEWGGLKSPWKDPKNN